MSNFVSNNTESTNNSQYATKMLEISRNHITSRHAYILCEYLHNSLLNKRSIFGAEYRKQFETLRDALSVNELFQVPVYYKNKQLVDMYGSTFYDIQFETYEDAVYELDTPHCDFILVDKWSPIDYTHKSTKITVDGTEYITDEYDEEELKIMAPHFHKSKNEENPFFELYYNTERVSNLLVTKDNKRYVIGASMFDEMQYEVVDNRFIFIQYEYPSVSFIDTKTGTMYSFFNLYSKQQNEDHLELRADNLLLTVCKKETDATVNNVDGSFVYNSCTLHDTETNKTYDVDAFLY